MNIIKSHGLISIKAFTLELYFKFSKKFCQNSSNDTVNETVEKIFKNKTESNKFFDTLR